MAILAAGAPGPATQSARASATPFAGAGVLSYGDAGFFGSPTNTTLNAPVVGMASTPTGLGYWLAAADGGVFAYGDAAFLGSAGDLPLQAPVISITSTGHGAGFWQLALDGGVFSYGTAAFYGSTGAITLNKPVVGMAATPTGHGYWLVASDGGVFAYGDASFFGSTGGMKLNQPIVGLASTPSGHGYWLVASDGGIFPFGDAAFYGSTGGQKLPASIIGMIRSPDGAGYSLAGWDGSIHTFGDAVSYGSDEKTVPTPPISSIQATPSGRGYWLLDPDVFPTRFSHPGPTTSLGASIVGVAASQIGADTQTGAFCNPYGPCEKWCALFASWVWQHAGVPIPPIAFTGAIYGWAANRGTALSPSARPRPGDLVLYGTGPSSTSTSVHVGVVAQVWPDGAIDTVEGDAGPGPYGSHNVIINGPFLPSQSADYNGFPVYAFAEA